MKYTLLLLFVFATSFTPPQSSVFICGSTGAKKYHLNPALFYQDLDKVLENH